MNTSQPPSEREEPAGLVCRHCGCRHFLRVSYTRQKDDYIRRKRICRNCGKPRMTTEK